MVGAKILRMQRGLELCENEALWAYKFSIVGNRTRDLVPIRSTLYHLYHIVTNVATSNYS